MESKQTIFVVIALLVLGGLAVWFLQSQEATAPGTGNETVTSTEESAENTQINNGPTAVLSVETDKESYAVGDQVALSFYVDSPVSIDGVDLTFMFDNTKLELVKGLAKGDFAKQISQIAQVNEAVKKDSVPTINYTKSTVTGTQTKYSFSALTAPGEETSGKTKLGTIYLRAKAIGDFPIVIAFEKQGVSTDSNVAYQIRDILGSVVGATVHVQTNTQ